MAQASSSQETRSNSPERPARRSPSTDKLILILLVAAVVLAFAQPTLGGVVRVTGSGDGCPDWPTCFNSWTPPWSDHHAIIEWSHRTVGAIFGAVILLATVLVWVRYPKHRALAYTNTASLILVSAVGGVGAQVVLSDLDPAIRTLHLAGAEVVAALTVVAMIIATYKTAYPNSWKLRPEFSGGAKLAYIAATLSLVTLLSGAYAVWRGAGAVCPEWPLCGGAVIPQSELVWIHVIHRIISLVTAIVVLYAAHRIYRMPGASNFLKIVTLAAPTVLMAQILMGAANPWTNFDEWARAGHLSLATLLWVNMIFVVSLIVLPVRRTADDDVNELRPNSTEMSAV